MDTLYTSKLVLHGSVVPAWRALNQTVRESGAMQKSPSSPKGFEGQSPSKPRMSGTGFASTPVKGTWNRWLRVPSAQVSQWRTNTLR